MASFMSSLFPGKDKMAGEASPRPSTPVKNNANFINPVSTPQGSPSKKTIPPGANDLSSAFESAMTLNPISLEAPVKLTRPQSVVTPLSPGKSNVQPLDEFSPNIDESVIHKHSSLASPLKKQQGQENTPPARSAGEPQPIHNHAAVTRQQLYEPKEHRPLTPAKKFNTSRGLTAEEREILQKPHVKRLST